MIRCTVFATAQTHDELKALAAETGQAMGEIVGLTVYGAGAEQLE